MHREAEARPVAVVTGAAGQLGQAIWNRLHHDGFLVAGIDTEELVAAGPTPPSGRWYPFDLRDADGFAELLTGIEADLGPISGLVNNAAIYPATPFLDVSVAEYDDVIAVNQRAYYFMGQAAAALMATRDGGAIVNISSITWLGILPKLSAYASTKGATVSLTRTMARELGAHGIRVNTIAPGAFPTKAEEIHENPEQYSAWVIDQQSLKRRGTPAELAATVSFFLGPDSAFVTGQTLNVCGGWMMS